MTCARWITTLVTMATLALVDRDAHATPCTMGKAGVVVTDDSTWVAVRLGQPPTSRLRLSFDLPTGEHEEVEWDPAVQTSLVRRVKLHQSPNDAAAPPARIPWSVTPSIDPQTYTQTQGTVLLFTKFKDLDASGAITSEVHLQVAALGAATAVPAAQAISGWPAPALSLSCAAPTATIADATFAVVDGRDTSGGLRGFGVAPTFVTDTLALLTEIAIDRARSGAMKVLKRRMVDPFCTSARKVTLKSLGLGDVDTLALPRTCEVLTSLRLEDILSSGRTLLFALRDDLRSTIAPALVRELTPDAGAARTALDALLTIVNTAIDRGGFDGLEGQLVLDLLGKLDGWAFTLASADALRLKAALDAAGIDGTKAVRSWGPDATNVPALAAALQGDAVTGPAVAAACQARLVVAVIKRCSHDACTAGQIADMLSAPEQSFAIETTLPAGLCWNHTAKTYVRPDGESQTEIAQLAIAGLRLIAPVVDGKGRDRAKAAVALAIDLARRWRPSAVATTDYLDTFGEIAIALIDEDYGTALGRFNRLLAQRRPQLERKEVRKLTQLIGAVAAYTAVYQATKDDDPKAARNARKQALSSIIDSATDRSDRDGDRVVSIGTNVGMSLTWANINSDDRDQSFDPGLRVPLQLSLEWLPPANGEWHERLGLRIGAQIADLGQFVRQGGDDQLDPVGWADFVSIGLEVGVLVGALDPALNVSLHAAYAPALTLDPAAAVAADGVWRYGVSLGYYVPFFDLN